jgi:hypothetical protein
LGDGELSSIKETLRKEIKETGNQLAVTFSKEETRCYKLKKGQKVRVTLEILEEVKQC